MRLDSWKEIASYLGRDVRTVIRWEQTRGLPVHRVPGGALSRVFAYPDELDRWLEGGGAAGGNGPTAHNGESDHAFEASLQDHAPPPAVVGPRLRQRRWWTLAACLALLTGLVVAWEATRRARSVPIRLAVVGNELLALDAMGRTQWVYRPDGFEIGPNEMRWSYVGDLDGDTRPDPIASLEIRRPDWTEHMGELRAFTPRGDPRWSLTPDDRVAFRAGEYGPPWPAKDLSVYHTRGQARVAWAVHHFTWWPSLLITLDGSGQRVGTFVNAGWIRGATRAPDERYLIVTGTTNSRDSSFFAVLDADRPTGHSPEPPGGRTECVRCPPGDPLQYVVLPRTDVSRQEPLLTDAPTVMTFADGTAQIHALESVGPNIAAVIYELTQDLTIREARLTDSYWEWHRRLEAQGKLNHQADECPERLGLDVQRWTPADGWVSQRVTVR